jgi:hypothetical protein
MWNDKTEFLRGRTGAAAVALVLAFTPALGSRAALAQEEAIETEVVVDRPMVVVRTGEDDSGFTWAFAGRRAFLGVQTVALSPELREHFGVPTEAGVLVSKIVEDSPAAGELEVGDIISAVDGEPIDSPSELARAIGGHESGDGVDLEVWRDGRVRSVDATLVEREAPSVDIRQFRVPHGHLQHWEWKDDELEGVIELDTETLNQAIERLNEELESPEWHARIHSFQEHQGTLMKRIELLESRLREMEEELRRLEEEDRQ